MPSKVCCCLLTSVMSRPSSAHHQSSYARLTPPLQRSRFAYKNNKSVEIILCSLPKCQALTIISSLLFFQYGWYHSSWQLEFTHLFNRGAKGQPAALCLRVMLLNHGCTLKAAGVFYIHRRILRIHSRSIEPELLGVMPGHGYFFKALWVLAKWCWRSTALGHFPFHWWELGRHPLCPDAN